MIISGGSKGNIGKKCGYSFLNMVIAFFLLYIEQFVLGISGKSYNYVYRYNVMNVQITWILEFLHCHVICII